MANNVTLSAGTADGAVIAADDIAGVWYQYNKVGIGADDTFTILVGGAGNVAAGVQRVTLAADDPAVVDLAAIEVLLTTIAGDTTAIEAAVEGTLTVAGTVDLGATDNAVLDAIAASVAAIDTDTTTIIGHLDGVEGILTTMDADTGGILTAIQIMDDWDESDRAKVNIIVGQAGIAAGTGVDGATVPRVTLATNVALPAGTNNIGDVDVLTVPRSMMGPAQPGTAIDSYTHAAFNLAAGANQVLASSAASKQIWVYGIGFLTNVAGTVSFQDEDDTAITGIMPFAANSGMVVSPSGNFSMPMWKLATDKDLEVDVVTAELDGWIDYAILSV